MEGVCLARKHYLKITVGVFDSSLTISHPEISLNILDCVGLWFITYLHR